MTKEKENENNIIVEGDRCTLIDTYNIPRDRFYLYLSNEGHKVDIGYYYITNEGLRSKGKKPIYDFTYSNDKKYEELSDNEKVEYRVFCNELYTKLLDLFDKLYYKENDSNFNYTIVGLVDPEIMILSPHTTALGCKSSIVEFTKYLIELEYVNRNNITKIY